MTKMHTLLDADNTVVRRKIYQGQLFARPATQGSTSLAKAVWDEVERELGADGPARTAQFRLSADEFFARVGRLRKRIYTSAQYHQRVFDLLRELGFSPADNAFDPIRLRVISHGGHHNPAARPMYHGHRDTWYSNPQSMITWWIPLHDVRPEETFEFFPDEFSREVSNDSEIFDFDDWVALGQDKRIGWQDEKTGRTAGYPRLLEPPQGRRIPVACGAGDVLLFSAQHLHQTRPNEVGETRFSIDFRTVHLSDHANGIGPSNIDNRSTGTSLRQFVYPERPRAS